MDFLNYLKRTALLIALGSLVMVTGVEAGAKAAADMMTLDLYVDLGVTTDIFSGETYFTMTEQGDTVNIPFVSYTLPGTQAWTMG